MIGVPNEDFGEEVKAVVQPRDWADAGPALAEELIAYCRAAAFADQMPALHRFRAPNCRAIRPASSTSA